MRKHMHQQLNVVYIKNWDDKKDPKEGVGNMRFKKEKIDLSFEMKLVNLFF
jgi:hypothetical protein